MRRAAKVDNNHVEIVLALKLAGYLVYRINDAALPDVWVAHPNHVDRGWWPLEIKGPHGRTTPAQDRWRASVGSAAGHIVRSPQEALDAVTEHFVGTGGNANGGRND